MARDRYWRWDADLVDAAVSLVCRHGLKRAAAMFALSPRGLLLALKPHGHTMRTMRGRG